MDYNQKKDKAKDEIRNWIISKESNDYSQEYIKEQEEKMKKIAKQFGLTKSEEYKRMIEE